MTITPLPISENRHALECAALAASIHKSKSEWALPFGIRPIDPTRFVDNIRDDNHFNLDEKEGVLFDPQTGLKVGLYEKEGILYVVFGALGSNDSEMSDKKESRAFRKKMLKSSVKSLVYGAPDFFDQADQLLHQIRAKSEGKQIHLSGQSLGAAIATYVSLKHQLPATALNSMALGPGLQKKIGRDNLIRAKSLITQIVTDGDWISNPPKHVRASSIFFELHGITTPAILGKRYVIPHAKAYETDNFLKSIGNIHKFILGNLLVHEDPKAEDLASKIEDPIEFSVLFNEWLREHP